MKKYKAIIVVDGITNGVVSIEKFKDSLVGTFFRFETTAKFHEIVSYCKNVFDLTPKDAENVIAKIRHGEKFFIGISDGNFDDVIEEHEITLDSLDENEN